MAAPVVPKIQDLADDIVAAFEAEFNITVKALPKAALRVIAKVVAAFFVTLFKLGQWNFLQQFVDTASFAETEVLGKPVNPLLELGRQRGTTDPKDPTAAELTIEIQVLAMGEILQAGEPFLGAGNGVTYLLTAPVELNAAAVYGIIKASADQTGGDGSGAQGNLEVGAVVAFANPRAQVGRQAVVTSIVVTGADGEDPEDYRDRARARYQLQPQGGASADYKIWAEETAGIVAAYPYTGDPDEIDLYVEATPASSGSIDGIPTVAQRTAVLQSVTYDATGAANRAPLGAFVNVLPISRSVFTVQVLGLSAPNLPVLRDSIDAAVSAKFWAYEPYIPGLSVGARRDFITEAEVVSMVASICYAAGATYGSIWVKKAGARVVFYTLGEGEKARGVTAWS